MSFEGLWAGRVAGPVGRRRSLAGGALGLSMAPVRGPAVHLCVAAGPGDSRRPPQVVRGLRG